MVGAKDRGEAATPFLERRDVKILQRVATRGVVAYQVAYAFLPGSNSTIALFLSQVAYWASRAEGSVWLTHEGMRQQTGLTKEQQDLAAKKLMAMGVLEKTLKGLPAKIHYAIDFDRLEELLMGCEVEDHPQPRLRETLNQGSGKAANQMSGNTPTGLRESRNHTNEKIQDKTQDEIQHPPTPPQAGGTTGRKLSAVQQEKADLAKMVEAIYKAYPRKVAPAAAMKAIEKACKLIEPKELLQAVQDYEAATSQWPAADRDFIPMPSTWFNQQRWLEDRREWTRKIPGANAPKEEAAVPKWKKDRIALAEEGVRAAERALRSLAAQGLTRQTCGYRFSEADDNLQRARQRLAAEMGVLGVGGEAETAATGLPA